MWPFAVRNACVATSIMGVLSVAASAQTTPTVPRVPTSPRADYKVVIWYRQDRPLDTFKYQIYDVRKGEYTPAVDAWLELMRSKHPAYLVAVRDVDLSREKGETESLKVGSVVMRELTAAASLEGIVVGGPIGGGLSRPSPRGPVSRRRRGTWVELPHPGWGCPGRSISIHPRTHTPSRCLIRGRIRDGVSPQALTGQGRQPVPSRAPGLRSGRGRSRRRRSAGWSRAAGPGGRSRPSRRRARRRPRARPAARATRGGARRPSASSSARSRVKPQGAAMTTSGRLAATCFQVIRREGSPGRPITSSPRPAR